MPPPAHEVLLTFDDGPVCGITGNILDELARAQVRAVFFVEGRKLAAPGLRSLLGPVLRRAVAAGHIMGNHGYSHVDLTRLPAAEIRDEIVRTELLLGDLLGDQSRNPRLFRPPFTLHDERVDAIVAELGYTLMLWNVDSLDWQEPLRPEHTAAQVRLRQAGGLRRSVCVFHERAETAQELPRLLRELRALPGVEIGAYPETVAQTVALPLDDGLLVARADTHALGVLNQTGSFIWECLAAGSSQEEAARSLAAACGVSADVVARDVVARDVARVVVEWRRCGILGPGRPEQEDPGPWPLNRGVAPDRSDVVFVETVRYRLLDFAFQISFESWQVAAEMRPRLANLDLANLDAACVDTEPEVFEVFASGGMLVLRDRGGVVACDVSPAVLGYFLFYRIVRRAHPQLQPMAWLHAAGLERGGTAIALAGFNGSGKSTLCGALARQGYRVFADDRVFLDAATLSCPALPNSISLKPGSWGALASRYPELANTPVVESGGERLRFLLPEAPAQRWAGPLTQVFFPKYGAGVAPECRELRAAEAIAMIAASASWVSTEPRDLERFVEWMRGVRFFAMTYSDTDAALRMLEERVAA